MFTSWVEGSGNVHGTDFELYASTIDALNDNNKYTACNFGSGRRAFAYANYMTSRAGIFTFFIIFTLFIMWISLFHNKRNFRSDEVYLELRHN